MNYVETRKVIQTINDIYKQSAEQGKYGCYGPGNAPERIVAELGGSGVEAIAAMIDYAAWDGRISQAARNWAASIPHYACKQGEWFDTDTIHKCHLSAIAEGIARLKQ